MAHNYATGKNLTAYWYPTGDTIPLTMAVQDASGEENIDKLDASNTATGGEQALMGGFQRASWNVKFLLDASQAPFASAQGIRTGTKGYGWFQLHNGTTGTDTIATTNADKIYGMITKVGRARPANGLVVIDATIESDYIAAVAGSATTSFAAPTA